MPRSSKDLAKRLRFDPVPRRDLFRRWYGRAALAALLAGVGLWLALGRVVGDEQYLPGPVAQSHATFGDRCEACHSPFERVADEACLACHPPRLHSVYEVRTPRCRECHVEHRSREALLAVSNQSCAACHGDLATTRPAFVVHPAIDSFADHPTFSPLREGRRDPAALRFNHRLHLTTDKIPARSSVACISCHRAEIDGRRMRPITFETHCRACHEQIVSGPLGVLEVPHTTPDAVREAVAARLLVAAVADPAAIFTERAPLAPGLRGRAPLDESRSLAEYQATWLARIEKALYAPLRPRVGERSLVEENKLCFLCHLGEGPADDGLATITPTDVPARWLPAAEFSHRRHDLLDCDVCHATIAESTDTADVNLPDVAVCRECHVDDATRSAGTRCPLCHLYHDTSRDPAMRSQQRPHVPLERLRAPS